MMDLGTAATILSILLGLAAIASILISVGREKQARVDLERRHTDLAKDAREGLSLLRAQNEKLSESNRAMEAANIELRTKHDALQSALGDVKREKASVESVEALREGMGRIEGIVASMERRLDVFMQGVTQSLTEDRKPSRRK